MSLTKGFAGSQQKRGFGRKFREVEQQYHELFALPPGNVDTLLDPRLAFGRFEQTLFAQPRVFLTERQELLVGSALNDMAAIKHENLVCVHDSGKPVSDHDGSASAHQILQRPLDEPLRRGVHARRRLIQNQNWRILQQRPRDREPLLFAHT
jgi:hypothetical protein